MSEAIKTLRQDPAPSHLWIQHVVTSGLKSPRLLFFLQLVLLTNTREHPNTLGQLCLFFPCFVIHSVAARWPPSSASPSSLDLYLQHNHCICMLHVLCTCLPLFFPSFPLGKSPLLSPQQEGSVRVFLPTVWGQALGLQGWFKGNF